MKLIATSIEGITVVETHRHTDSRGAFSRLFCEQELGSVLANRRISQINHSRTTQAGAIRGMHFQYPPCAEMKLVRCLRGRVWDVAVDLRKGSPTFLRWHAEELSADNARMVAIAEGFAHGFQVLDADSELLYLHTAPYAAGFEGGVRHDDPLLAISWPLPTTDISMRDTGHPFINAGFQGISA